MFKKGQAAMEFLMTYGWAILAAIIAIGVLAYFGVFSPGKFVGNNYIINAPFNVQAGATSTSNIQLELLNGAGETLNLTRIDITNCNIGQASGTFGTNQPTGNTTLYTVTCSPVLVSGATFRGDVTVKYKKQGSALELQSTGSITAKVA